MVKAALSASALSAPKDIDRGFALLSFIFEL